MEEAIKKLEEKNFHVCNQFDGWTGTETGKYELWGETFKSKNELLLDNLNEAQVIALANIL
jgi:hypothetical protein